MKRMTQAVAVATLVFGAQAAWAGESITLPSPAAEHPEGYVTVAQMGAAESQQGGGMQAAPRSRGARDLLEELGLAGEGPFPSRGGPIDE